MAHGDKKKTNLQQVREHLAGLGFKEFRSTDMPIVSCVHGILKKLEDNGEIIKLRYDKGNVYQVNELKNCKIAEPVFTVASPYPYKPFLPGYMVLKKHTYIQQ